MKPALMAPTAFVQPPHAPLADYLGTAKPISRKKNGAGFTQPHKAHEY